MAKRTVVEFFSGVGGWSYALEQAAARNEEIGESECTTAIEININANDVYRDNFPTHEILCKDIRHLKADRFARLHADTWLMSPPCQPYTTLGKQLGAKDSRAGALHHLCDVLKELGADHQPQFICLENVPGFQSSESRDLWIETLRLCNYNFQEFLLSPTQFSLPNERLRYFCAARKVPWKHEYEGILNTIPGDQDIHERAVIDDSQFYQSPDYLDSNVQRSLNYFSHCKQISEYLELEQWGEEQLIDEKFTKRCSGYKHDLVGSACRRSSCFTSGYFSTARGAGSLLLDSIEGFDAETRKKLPEITPEIIQQGLIRFFTPREVANLMGFPPSFRIDSVTTKAAYKLLGNSINVECASHVLEFLFQEPMNT